MTGQVPDSVWYRDESYAICGVAGTGLFEPAAYQLTVSPISTACWRGYVADYSVVDGALVLVDLTLGLSGAPKLFGARAKRDRRYGTARRYSGLREPCRFTGGLLLGNELVCGGYVHMGFQRGWKYRTVHELIFDGGRLTAAHDRSAEMARRRETAPDDRPDRTDPEAVQSWIHDTFSLRYESLD